MDVKLSEPLEKCASRALFLLDRLCGCELLWVASQRTSAWATQCVSRDPGSGYVLGVCVCGMGPGPK